MNNWAAHRHRSIPCPTHCTAQTRWLTLQNPLQWHFLIEMYRGWEAKGNEHCSSHRAWWYAWDHMQANIILSTKLYTNPLAKVYLLVFKNAHAWWCRKERGSSPVRPPAQSRKKPVSSLQTDPGSQIPFHRSNCKMLTSVLSFPQLRHITKEYCLNLLERTHSL